MRAEKTLLVRHDASPAGYGGTQVVVRTRQADVEKVLERALAARGEHEVVLARLVEAWRLSHAPELAVAIDRVSRVVTAEEPPIKARTVAAREAAWKALAASHDPLVLGRLLSTPWPKRHPDIEARLLALSAWPDDPRIGEQVLADFAAISPRLFDSLLELIARIDDWSRIEGLRQNIARRWRSEDHAHNALSDIRAHWEARRVEVVPLTAAAVETLRELGYEERARREDESRALPDALFANVYEDPADDSRRLVLADLLQQRGEPRGELIALQYRKPSAAVERRVRALLKEHGKSWLGPMHADLRDEGWSFERGFPVCAVVDALTGDRAKRITGHPEWATYEHIVFSGASFTAEGLVDFVRDPAMRSLRGVHELRASDFEALARADVALECADVKDVGELPPMRGLHTLGCYGYPDLEPIYLSELWPQLRHFVIGGLYRPVLAQIEERGAHIASLTFIQRIPKYLHLPESSRLILRRSPAGRLTELTVDWPGNPRARYIHRELPSALRALNEVIEISSFTLEPWPKFEKARQTQIEIDWVVDKNLPRDARIALPWRDTATSR